MFLRSFLRRNHLFGYYFSEKISYDLCTSFALCKVKRTIGRFQLEAPRAYECKQILGLCQELGDSIVHPTSDSVHPAEITIVVVFQH
jgi:hypothetical protein